MSGQTRIAEGGQIAEQTAPGVSDLLPMDRSCLSYLFEMGGRAPIAAIPSKLFKGIVPAGHLDLVDLGYVSHDGDDIVLTSVGYSALASAREVRS